MSNRPSTLVEGVFDDGTYLMPTFFGALPYPLPPARYGDTTNLGLSFDTDGDMLARLLPPGFVLTEPRLHVSLINNRQVEWLAGGGYNLLAVNVPVRFEGKKDVLEGVFGLVVWENLTAPIIMGRDIQGVPKIYAEVDCFREFPVGFLTADAHLNGCRFARIQAELGDDLEGDELEDARSQMTNLNWFGWRHFPNVGAPGAALSHPVVFPQEFNITGARHAEATLEWTVPDFASNPTQLALIAALSAFPNLGNSEAFLVRCENILRADLARIPE